MKAECTYGHRALWVSLYLNRFAMGLSNKNNKEKNHVRRIKKTSI